MTPIGTFCKKGITLFVLVTVLLTAGNYPYIHQQHSDVVSANMHPESLNPDFYITSNFTVNSSEKLFLDNYSIVLWSTSSSDLTISILGKLTLANCSMEIENISGNILRSVNINVSGSNSSLVLYNSSINLTGGMVVNRGSLGIYNSSLDTGSESQGNRLLSFPISVFNGTAVFRNSSIGGLDYLEGPGDFSQANIYATNALQNSPLAAPGKIRVRSSNTTDLNPHIDAVNVSMQYTVTSNESDGVYFDIVAAGKVIANRTIPYSSSEGERWYNFSENVSFLNERSNFFTNSSDFYFDTSFNYNRTLAIYNLSADLESNSWVDMYGRQNFHDTFVNSSVIALNSSLPFNEGSWNESDGASSYQKDFWYIQNSSALIGDSNSSDGVGIYSPFEIINSTVSGARLVEFEGSDSGYPYPLENASINVLSSLKSLDNAFMTSQAALKDSELHISYGTGNKLMEWVPYFSIVNSQTYTFENYEFSLNSGLYNGTISLRPFPEFTDTVHKEPVQLSEPVVTATINDVRLIAGVGGTYSLGFADHMNSNLSGSINLSFSGPGNYHSAIAVPFNIGGSTEINGSFNLSNTAGTDLYMASLSSFKLDNGADGIIISGSVNVSALFPSSPYVENVTEIQNPWGYTYLRITMNSSLSAPVHGFIMINESNGSVVERNETVYPGIQSVSINSSDFPDIKSVAFISAESANNGTPFTGIYKENASENSVSAVTFTESGLQTGEYWGVELNSTWYISSGNSLSLELEDGNYTVQAMEKKGFSTEVQRNITVDASVEKVYINYTRILYLLQVLNSHSQGIFWTFSIEGKSYSTNSDKLMIALPEGNYTYVAEDSKGYGLVNGSGNISIQGNASINLLSIRNYSFTEDLMKGISGNLAAVILSAMASGSLFVWRLRRRWRFR